MEEDFFSNLFNSPHIVILMVTVVLALLTVIIPLGIYVLGRLREKKIYWELDRVVILDYIIKGKYFLIYVLLVYFPLFFWSISSNLLKSIEIFFWLLGIIFIVNTIRISYQWIKGYDTKIRFQYLKKLNDLNYMEVVWNSVWQSKKIPINDECTFFKIYSNKMNRLIEAINKYNKFKESFKKLIFLRRWLEKIYINMDHSKKNKKVTSLLAILTETIDKRSANLFFYETPQFLEWNYFFWNESERNKKNDHLRDNYNNYLNTNKIIGNSIEDNFMLGYGHRFIDFLEEHINKVNNKKYISVLFNLFYNNFYENFEVYSKKTVAWEDYIPKEWKVTKDNILDRSNYISKLTLNEFLEWGRIRILTSEEKYDKTLDEAIKGVFPEVDPIIWSIILIFVYSGYDPDNRCKSIITRRWNFGFFGRVRIYSNRDIHRKEQELEIKNTFELAIVLFKDLFSKDNLVKFIEELESLTFDKNSFEESKKENLLYILREMLNTL